MHHVFVDGANQNVAVTKQARPTIMSQSYTGKIFKRSVGMHDLHHLFIYEMVFRSSTQTEGIKTWQPMIAVKKKEEPSFKADAEQTNKYGQEQTTGNGGHA